MNVSLRSDRLRVTLEVPQFANGQPLGRVCRALMDHPQWDDVADTLPANVSEAEVLAVIGDLEALQTKHVALDTARELVRGYERIVSTAAFFDSVMHDFEVDGTRHPSEELPIRDRLVVLHALIIELERDGAMRELGFAVGPGRKRPTRRPLERWSAWAAIMVRLVRFLQSRGMSQRKATALAASLLNNHPQVLPGSVRFTAEDVKAKLKRAGPRG